MKMDQAPTLTNRLHAEQVLALGLSFYQLDNFTPLCRVRDFPEGS
jgi:hypothetical protein